MRGNMRIDGYTRVCGVMGNPVEHTMSPVIHNTLAEKLGDNLVYVPLHVEKGRAAEAAKGAYALNFLGLNVTVPFKSEVLPALTKIDPLAERIGAVNTLVRDEEGFKGYNTDMPGLYRAMESDGVRIEGEEVLLLGAGGVARAVAVLLAEKGASRIHILNRTLEKARAIAGEVNGYAGRELVLAHGLEDWKNLLYPEGEGVRPEKKYLAIQCTNCGMFPRTDQVPIADPAFYEGIHTGYDLIFNPSRTRFMELTARAGGRSFGGLKMLLYQGVIAYELWTGKRVEEDLAREVYGRMKEAMGIE